MKSIIILGSGPSVLKSSKKFVESHDEVCIINRVVFTKEYEPYIGLNADSQFCNSSVITYSKKIFTNLNLKQLYFTGRQNQKWRSFPSYYNDVTLNYPTPNYHTLFMQNFGFDPSSGVQALYHWVNSKQYSKISIVGFDFYQIGTPPYYFRLEESWPEIQKRTKEKGIGWITNDVSGHDPTKSIEFCHKIFKENPNINFNIISNNIKFTSLITPNVKYHDYSNT